MRKIVKALVDFHKLASAFFVYNRIALMNSMLRLTSVIAFLCLTCTGLFAFQNEEVSEENIRDHVKYLASDELEGRGTNSKGYVKASDYAEAQFKSYKLRPLIKSGGAESFFQEFAIKGPFAKRIRSKQDFSQATSRNVVGWVEGTDPTLKDQYIVLSAHLDHVGKIDGVIHNGANDNATGSAAILELARVISQRPLKRSVIFVLFGAEEIGLVGSKYYVENPPVALSKVVANLNIDGIGAYVDQPGNQLKVMAIGAALPCKDLLTRLNQVNDATEKLELSTNDPQGYIMRSDQYNFLAKDVPVIMFTDYGNGHYHEPTDDAHRLQYGKLTRLVNMIHQLTCDLGDGVGLCR